MSTTDIIIEPYLKRCEDEFIAKNYTEALKILDQAIQDEKEDKKVYIIKKIDILDSIDDTDALYNYIKDNITIFTKNFSIKELCNIILDKIKDNNLKLSILRSITYSNDKYDYILLSNIVKLGDKNFVYGYVKSNIDKIIKSIGKKELMSNIKTLGFCESEKEQLFKMMLNKFKFEFFIMEDLLNIGCKEYVYNNIEMIISIYSSKLDLQSFSQNIYELSLEKKSKIDLLKLMLEKNAYEFSIVENLIKLEEIDYSHSHIDKIIEKHIHKMDTNMFTNMIQNLSLPSENKKELFLDMLNKEPYDFYILNALISLEDKKITAYVENYISENIDKFLVDKDINFIIEEIKNLNLTNKSKKSYLEEILKINPSEVTILEAILNYLEEDEQPLDKVNEIIENTYKKYNNMLQIYLIKSEMLETLSKYKEEISILKKCLKLDGEFNNKKESGDILYKISKAYAKLAEINNNSRQLYKKSLKYYKKSKKHGNVNELPKSQAREEAWEIISKYNNLNNIAIVIIGCILIYILA